MAEAAEHRMGDFKPQEFANTSWAFATAGQLDSQHVPLFAVLARAADRQMGEEWCCTG